MNTKTKELPENIKTWVDALESGEYNQCQGALHKGEGYCCLGVYAKVVLMNTNDEILSEENENGDLGPAEIYDDMEDSLDLVFQKAIIMNDGGDTFVCIANMIREAYT